MARRSPALPELHSGTRESGCDADGSGGRPGELEAEFQAGISGATGRPIPVSDSLKFLHPFLLLRVDGVVNADFSPSLRVSTRRNGLVS
jgi:hypothetical protein